MLGVHVNQVFIEGARVVAKHKMGSWSMTCLQPQDSMVALAWLETNPANLSCYINRVHRHQLKGSESSPCREPIPPPPPAGPWPACAASPAS